MGSAHSERHPLVRLEARAVAAGLVSGLLAGLAMGLVLQFGTDLVPELGAFLGERSVLRGWLVHLVVSAVYGVAFAVIVAYPPVRNFFDSFGVREYVLVGVTYATMIAAVSIGLLPFVFELPWAPGSGQIEGSPGPGLAGLVPAMLFAVGHLVYGAVLGGAYAAIGESSV